MAKSADKDSRWSESFVDTVKMRHKRINLESVGSQKRITVPKEYKGFKIYPITNDVTFAVDEASGPQQPETTGATGDALSIDSDFKRGGYAVAFQWEVRQFNSGDNPRTLIITAAVASTDVIVEVWE